MNDYEGAKKHFDSKMGRWTFVYNQSELPAGCGKFLGELRENNPQIGINAWLRIDIQKFALELSPEDLAILLPGWQ
ncbi:MAG: hypothetical protein ABJJ43_06515, partial [Ekhidna sp.]